MITCRWAVFILAVFLVASASGYPIAYTLVGVQFNDGGAAFGSFIYDPATNVYSNVNITTTDRLGSQRGDLYVVCGQDVPSCTGVAPNSTELLNLTTSDAEPDGRAGSRVVLHWRRLDSWALAQPRNLTYPTALCPWVRDKRHLAKMQLAASP